MKFYKTICDKDEILCQALNDKFYLKKIEPESDSVFWGRKTNVIFDNSIDLSDILNFHRIYSIENIASFAANKNISSYIDSKSRVKNIIKSYRNIIKDASQYNIVDLVPECILEDYSLQETKILKDTFEYVKDTNENFDFIINFFKHFKYFDCLKKLNYNILTSDGTKKVDLIFQANFRLKSSPGYFNLFNMQKEERAKIVPHDKDSFIYCADFRQFEIRTFCLLNPTLDVDFSNREIYKDLAQRLKMNPDDAKVQIIAYGYGQQNDVLDKVLNRKAILERVDNNFYKWRKYPVILRSSDTESVKIHTIVQTISQYIYFEKLYEVLKLLDGKRSKFIFPLHDSVILSIHRDEKYLMDSIKNILEDDVYKIKEYIGKDFLNIKQI